jgi:prepilin-type N-terminal cleavage/methylation domain-containing protein
LPLPSPDETIVTAYQRTTTHGAKKMMKTLRSRDGFSLIELMIVVVIIGILAAIAIPRFSNISDRARQSEVEPILRQVATMQEMHMTDKGAYTTDFADLAGYGLGSDANGAAPNDDTFQTKYFSIQLTPNGNGFCAQATPNPADVGAALAFSNGKGVKIDQTGVLERGTGTAAPACATGS